MKMMSGGGRIGKINRRDIVLGVVAQKIANLLTIDL